MQAHRILDEKPFSRSAALFDGLVSRLGETDVLKLPHGEVERLVEELGGEVLRQLLEDHFALRAPAKVPGGKVEGADGETRSHRREMTRTLTTTFGPVTLVREGYRQRGVGALAPLDAELNLPRERYSHGVRRKVAELVGKTSFEDAATTVAKQTRSAIPKRQVEEMAQSIAVDFDDYYAQHEAEPAGDEATLLVLGFDGTGVHMRPESLRDATRKQREREHAQEPKQWPAPVSSGPRRDHGTRSAMVSVIYEVAPFVRTYQDVLRDLRPVKIAEELRPRRPLPQAKRVAASLVKSVRTVVKEGFEDAKRRDPELRKHWVVVLDGNEHQLEAVQSQARHVGIEVTIVLDFIHVAGYVWGAAKALFPDDQDRRREWVMEKLTYILWGEAANAAAAMRRSATKRKFDAKTREPIDDCADYLLKYQMYLCYDAALAQGVPITTGAVEGACRHLVKDRMAITGARWGLKGGESVLRLRALLLSGDLDDYLDFHEGRELHRNHLSSYAGGKAPQLVLPGRREPVLKLVN